MTSNEMMQCPVCKTTYTDATLRYCLTDRAKLVAVDESGTGRRAEDPMRIDIDIPSSSTLPRVEMRSVSNKGFPIFKLLIGIALTAILVFIVAAIAGTVFYFKTSNGVTTNQNIKQTTPSPAPSASPTLDLEKQKLDEQIANLKKQLDDQQNSDRPKPPPFPTPSTGQNTGTVTARVNSPGDGFLAMRSEPSVDRGERVTQIPNGETINIQDCQRQSTTVSGRSGRWCMITYNGRVGWVFDAWLIR